jgi:hypothetical protein
MWPTVSRPIRLGFGHPFGSHGQILLFPFFCRKIALLFVSGRLLWREDGSLICSAICQWPESRTTHKHTLLSHLRQFPFLSSLTTRRDYGGSILTHLHIGKVDFWWVCIHIYIYMSSTVLLFFVLASKTRWNGGLDEDANWVTGKGRQIVQQLHSCRLPTVQ